MNSMAAPSPLNCHATEKTKEREKKAVAEFL
jgi:hypothetical protein